jgi:integrating conjugative element protein (TIGR03749 family)
MKINKWPFLLFVTTTLASFHSVATDIIHYENLPVTIDLIEGQERSIQFGDHVSVGITKGQQTNHLFRIQSAQGAIHILPHTTFDKQRIQIKRASDGRVLLLDLISRKAEPSAQSLEDVRIYLQSENVITPPKDEIAEEQNTPELPSVSPIDLTRFVAQRLYGPSRLHDDLQGVSEAALGVKGAIRIFKGDNKIKTYSEAIVGYYGGGHYLAAIHIRNLSKNVVTLNYLDLNLPFDYATFQHHSLNAAGTPGDSTVLYLISEKPLNETLYPWTYYQDLEAEKKGSRSSGRD